MPALLSNDADQQFDLIVVDVFVGVEVPQQFKEEKFLSGLGAPLSALRASVFNVAIHNEEVQGPNARICLRRWNC
jgi:hypothetical protein